MVVRHDEKTSGPRRDIGIENGRLGEDGNDEKRHAPAVAKTLAQHVSIADAFRSPRLPATDGNQPRDGRQDIADGNQRHGDAKAFGNHFRVFNFSGHIGYALVTAVHPDHDADAAAQTVDDGLSARHDGIDGIVFPVGKPHDGDGGKGDQDRDGQN